MATNPTISVVIPTKNGGRIFQEVLAGLSAQKGPASFEILVIDSGSSDDTVAAARRNGARVIQISPESFNHGLTRNRGVAESGGQFVVLMTQDAVPGDESLLYHLTEPFADPEVAGVYARQMPRPDADAITRRNVLSWPTASLLPRISWVGDRAGLTRLDPIGQILHCKFDSVCAALRRKTWESIPFPKTDFGEDLRWGKKVLESGWKIWYQPHAVVYHSHDRSILYEYKRYYAHFRLLHDLFGIETRQTFRSAVEAMAKELVTDIPYILRYEIGLRKKIEKILLAPAATFARMIGEYLAGKDGRMRKKRKITGL